MFHNTPFENDGYHLNGLGRREGQATHPLGLQRENRKQTKPERQSSNNTSISPKNRGFTPGYPRWYNTTPRDRKTDGGTEAGAYIPSQRNTYRSSDTPVCNLSPRLNRGYEQPPRLNSELPYIITTNTSC
ncbi:hypothetical protein Bbelb_290850 [Branchiostoma belcheri]|nr:hypothetical protein Bbelb_290850 [Branchiostoma belcheri]